MLGGRRGKERKIVEGRVDSRVAGKWGRGGRLERWGAA